MPLLLLSYGFESGENGPGGRILWWLKFRTPSTRMRRHAVSNFNISIDNTLPLPSPQSHFTFHISTLLSRS